MKFKIRTFALIDIQQMNLEKHVSGLLFEHDCVIVPGFGGFVCNYSPARMDSAKQQFHPPFKKISFNRNLKNNDGLLADRVSQTEKISYAEANLFIAACMEQLNKELSVNKRFDLKNIGTFYPGEENTLLFEQDKTMNYLPESFGRTAFYFPAIKREPIERKIEKQWKDKKIIPSKEKKEPLAVKKRIPAVRYMAVVASLLIIASLVFIPVFTGTDLLKRVTISTLNPFSEKIQPLYHSSEVVLPENKNENTRNPLSANDTMRFLTIMLDGKIPIVVSLTENKIPVIKTAAFTHHTARPGYPGSNRFHIIGGAFAVPENARKFCSKLLKQGYDARIIDKKLRLVSYGGFPTRHEALQALEKIRAVQNDVWLMKM